MYDWIKANGINFSCDFNIFRFSLLRIWWVSRRGFSSMIRRYLSNSCYPEIWESVHARNAFASSTFFLVRWLANLYYEHLPIARQTSPTTPCLLIHDQLIHSCITRGYIIISEARRTASQEETHQYASSVLPRLCDLAFLHPSILRHFTPRDHLRKRFEMKTPRSQSNEAVQSTYSLFDQIF